MRKLTRRELLKVSLGTMGALALANLPNWNKPALRVGVLPAHAQFSLDQLDLRAVLTWNKGIPIPPQGEVKEIIEDGRVDLDLYVWEPSGALVFFANKVGPTATLDFDNLYGFGPEITTVPLGMAATGRYWIGVMAPWISVSQFPVTATLKITSFQNTPSQQTATFTFVIEGLGKVDPSVQFPVATVDYQTGVISPWNYAKDVVWPVSSK
jgi:hypothetical protein